MRDIQGKILFTQKKPSQNGMNCWTVSTAALPTGLYFITIDRTATQRFLIIH
ncbi:MAG: T9SS type A sorting domain-containing protein [Phaeodactylibacter sp.]|nr:T9SS type A sorting domain-containing protein [Phaeodactylibacter sp.]